MDIREIELEDNQEVENLIRFCLKEFGADKEGTAWTDPNLGTFYQLYRADKSKYWVAVQNDKIVGGVGIGPLVGVDRVCELQKMYTYPEVRGTGIAKQLIDVAHKYAKQYYEKCYLETFENMKAAQRFYEKNGYQLIEKPLGNTGHFSCDVLYLKEL